MKTKILLIITFTFGCGASFFAQEYSQEIQKAINLYEEGEYQKVCDFLEKLLYPLQIKGIENITQAHLYLGLSWAMLGEEEKAREEFKEALKLDPELSLDPDYFLPKIISLFEEVKRDQIPQLSKKPSLPQKVTAPEKKGKENFILNFLPGGVPQFQDQAILKGGIVFSIQTLSLLTSILSYLEYKNNHWDSEFRTTKEGHYQKAEEIIIRMQITFWISVTTYLWSVIDGIIY
jgi:tetratricopeptide (TPR) repeat protein